MAQDIFQSVSCSQNQDLWHDVKQLPVLIASQDCVLNVHRVTPLCNIILLGLHKRHARWSIKGLCKHDSDMLLYLQV